MMVEGNFFFSKMLSLCITVLEHIIILRSVIKNIYTVILKII